IFGPLPPILPVLRIRNHVVELVTEFKYVGIWYTSTHSNIFAKHYTVKASKSRATSNVIFGLNHRIGSLPVLVLYTARVDCYLISGCELALDTDDSLIRELVDVQHSFLRRLLGLNPHSMLAILFTETEQVPLRIRRILLALGRLMYMIAVEPGRVVQHALLDSIALLREGKPGWASDLVIMLRRLPTPVEVSPDDLLNRNFVTNLAKRVILINIDHLVKTHLLRNRLEMNREECSLQPVTRRLRHYLTMVAVPAHRKAITSLYLGDHNLSVERLRYPSRYRGVVPRAYRLCRLCRGAVEDEVHALFDCATEIQRLEELRSRFMDTLSVCDPQLRAARSQLSRYEFLLKLVSSRKAVQAFAKYVFDILTLFQEFPRYFPVVFRLQG
ncbi:hypothetical protein FB451DRAFT_1051101, partial [Mycena latifolia]